MVLCEGIFQEGRLGPGRDGGRLRGGNLAHHGRPRWRPPARKARRARHSGPRSTPPMRPFRWYRWSDVFKNTPSEEPRAIPGAPSQRISSHASAVDTTSDEVAIFTGVRVSRMA